VTAVSVAMKSGRIKPVIGRELLKAAGTMGTVVRGKHNLTEIEQLRDLVKRQEAAARAAQATAATDRYGDSETHEYDADDDGAKAN
jgi:hypothetical protein